ncbi:MAG: DUF2628 domain-containing protein [Rhodospirillales bacterium]
MKVFTVHVRRHGLDPDRDFMLVPEGFSFWAFVLTFVWALYHRLWLTAIILGVLHAGAGLAVIEFGANDAVAITADIVVAVLFGLSANDLRRAKLAGQGFVEEGVASGRSVEDAERRYLDDNPALAAAMIGAAR